RRWDSNPRYREAVHRFSRPALSTTQAPLRIAWIHSIQFRRDTAILEEETEDFPTFLLHHTRRDRRAVNDASNSTLHNRPGAHGARLERDVKRAALQPPRSEGPPRQGDRQPLG